MSGRTTSSIGIFGIDPDPGLHPISVADFFNQGVVRPWDNANERVIKAFNLRLPEPLHMKLQFIAEHTPHSIHSFVMEAVEAAVERELKNLT